MRGLVTGRVRCLSAVRREIFVVTMHRSAKLRRSEIALYAAPLGLVRILRHCYKYTAPNGALE